MPTENRRIHVSEALPMKHTRFTRNWDGVLSLLTNLVRYGDDSYGYVALILYRMGMLPLHEYNSALEPLHDCIDETLYAKLKGDEERHVLAAGVDSLADLRGFGIGDKCEVPGGSIRVIVCPFGNDVMGVVTLSESVENVTGSAFSGNQAMAGGDIIHCDYGSMMDEEQELVAPLVHLVRNRESGYPHCEALIVSNDADSVACYANSKCGWTRGACRACCGSSRTTTCSWPSASSDSSRPTATSRWSASTAMASCGLRTLCELWKLWPLERGALHVEHNGIN